jgi:thiol-disulfide isomerase/thioredoxin
MLDYKKFFSVGLSYHDFLARHANSNQQARWQATYDEVHLSEPQTSLLKSFKRRQPVLCLAGAWCGDCSQQCPLFERFAQETANIELRFLDRDTHPELASEIKICGGGRVPIVVFLSEDYQFVALGGDRTLAKYRNLAKNQLGSSCPTGLVKPEAELFQAVIQEWLDQLERAQLILRLSPRLRQLHND